MFSELQIQLKFTYLQHVKYIQVVGVVAIGGTWGNFTLLQRLAADSVDTSFNIAVSAAN